ncbi:MAG: hypothetical protein HY922_13685 [Elusimicrobia bacterium]|nr:hypothetical protein [Elusimicrobiota bacterium]
MPRLSLSTTMSLQGRLKLAHLLEMPEAELERLVQSLEKQPVFKLLKSSGVLRVTPFPKAFFTARRFAGWGLRTSSEGLPDLLDGNCELARLMQRIGVERFEACFLKEEKLSDSERARRCGISAQDAKRLREFMDRAFIRAEFERPAPLPEKVFSAVAGIEIQDGRPVLGFFNREIWRGRYCVEAGRLAVFLRSQSARQAERAQALLRRLEFLDQRKTTLYRALEALIEAQAGYLKTGEPSRRQPLTQRALATALDADPSALNRLISNKSIQLPWGLEAPIKALVPSAKTLALDRLYDLACANPSMSDEGLRKEMAERHNVHLSRRSIAQYRKNLKIGKRGLREGAAVI